MKVRKTAIAVAAIFAAVCSEACMTFVVGKRASSTGHVIVGHNEDDWPPFQCRHGMVAARDWPVGAMLPASPGLNAKIPQSPHTLAMYWGEVKFDYGDGNADTFFNERGVFICSDSGGNSTERMDDSTLLTEGGVKFNLRRMVGERATSARDGVRIIGEALERYGYQPSARIYTVADKDEAWLVQVVHGRHFAAVRVPDDEIAIMPNLYTIYALDAWPAADVIISKGLVENARAKGLWDGKGKFNFAAAYQASYDYGEEHAFEHPNNTGRFRQAIRLITGEEWPEGKPFPFSVKPKKLPFSADDLRAVLTAHNAPLKNGCHDLYTWSICSSTTIESEICVMADKVENAVMEVALGRGCERPYLRWKPFSEPMPSVMDDSASADHRLAQHVKPDPTLNRQHTRSREKVDPRRRTYVDPLRVVWSQGAIGAEKLLEAKFGQVSEGYFGTDTGTRLENRGETAGVILDFGRELHGGVQLAFGRKVTPGARLRLRFGESVSETMSSVGDGKHATNDHAMRDFELTPPSFGTLEVGSTGFRFLRVDLVNAGGVGLESVRAVSLMRPMTQIGGFRSSDERLNRVFDTAVRTVHLCCQDYLWDGIKRDRLVWMGDTHPETMAILSVFGAASILPDSLDYMAAVTPPDKWMNTMPTYTFWWIRNVCEWYRYTGDRAYLAKHVDYLERTFEHLLTGLDEKSGEWRAGNFLDWPTKHNAAAATAGTQGLALITARETAFLAEELGLHELVGKARRFAARLEKLHPEPHGAKSAAALLALSGLREPREMFDLALGRKGHQDVSTFYGYYMLEAMSAAGENQRALDTVRDYWGAMLDVGATSFWEDFNLAWTNNCFRLDELPVAGKRDIHGDYGEFCYPGFRHSLCHGWSAGPAPWCIGHVLGIRPLDVGCRTVEVSPFLGDLAWAEGAMALPNGEAVKVRVEKKDDGTLNTIVSAPPGVKILKRR